MNFELMKLVMNINEHHYNFSECEIFNTARYYFSLFVKFCFNMNGE